MKSKFLVIFVLLLSSATLFGREEFKREFSLGISSGITAANVSFVPNIRQNLNLKLNGGITGRFISERHFGLQVEVNYSQRGWRTDRDDEFYYNRSMEYIEIPFLTHLYFGDRVRFILNFGPKVSFLLSDRVSTNLPELPDAAPYVEIRHWFDYGITAGGGVEFRTGRISYIIEGRYYFGLSDIFSNSRRDRHMMLRSANRGLSLNLTLLYTI